MDHPNVCSLSALEWLIVVVPGQRSLFASGEVGVDPDARWDRLVLDNTSWVDVCRGHLRGADTVLDVVLGAVPWVCGRRRMYDRMVDDPRLSYRVGSEAGHPELVPHPVLAQVRDGLAERYGVTLGAAAFNYYRDGRDSVAPHGDRELRDTDDSLVCLLTLGATRPFRLRPHGRTGVPTHDVAPGSGDVLVMGGACQRDWEHAVPKVRVAGPRVSVTWRWVRRST
jgi:alkylated DNA repair dioxygenase AlkB